MKLSRTIAGVVCLGLLIWPIVLAPFKSDETLAFVRTMENRVPEPFPPYTHAAQLLDSSFWSQVSGGIKDRVPCRGALIQLRSRADTVLFAKHRFGDIALGKDGWLFYHPSLSARFASVEQIESTLSMVDAYIEEHRFKAELILLAAPDKATIYPEFLLDEFRAEVQTVAPQRALIRDWYAGDGPARTLDVWTPMLALKATHQAAHKEPVYSPADSHYTSLGSMVLAKAMLDAVDPALWDQSEVTHLSTARFRSEFRKMAGLFDRLDTFKSYEIRRAGVELVSAVHNGADLAGLDRPARKPGADRKPIRYTNRSATRALIPGRTLVIHDSFIAKYLRPSLRPFFEDISFVHFETVSPAAFQHALNDYDLVFVEAVERTNEIRLRRLFAHTGQPPPVTIAEIVENGVD